MQHAAADSVLCIGDEVQKDLRKLVHNFLSFARGHEPEKQYIEVMEAVDQALALKAHDLRVNNVELKSQFDPALPKTMADQHQPGGRDDLRSSPDDARPA